MTIRVYSNCCCSCSFEAEIIKISQSSHKMYSNNILNFQESTTILNARTKSLKTYWIPHVQRFSADTRCSPEDLLEAMDNREEWQERVMDIRGDGATWWWSSFSTSFFFFSLLLSSFNKIFLSSRRETFLALFCSRNYKAIIHFLCYVSPNCFIFTQMMLLVSYSALIRQTSRTIDGRLRIISPVGLVKW